LIPHHPTLEATSDGSPTLRDNRYQATFHSLHGAIQESRHVYINAGFAYVAAHKTDLTVLEVGFGTGLDALLTALSASETGCRVHYIGLDNQPLPHVLLSRLNYPALLQEPHASTIWEDICRTPWNSPSPITPLFSLHKVQTDFATYRPTALDLIYYDAFGPSAQSELWTTSALSPYTDALKTGGVLTTYCAQGAFRRALKELGLQVEKLPGPPGKREMVRAVK